MNESSISKPQFDQLIKSFNFKDLFNELGWDHFDNVLPIAVGEEAIKLTGIAEKRSFAVLHCPPLPGARVPNSALRKQIQSRVAKSHYENLLIYTDQDRKQQVWQLATKEENKPRQVHEVVWHAHQDPEKPVSAIEKSVFCAR